MNSTSIESLLKSRHAWFKGPKGDETLAVAHADLSKSIAEHYDLFERVRDGIFRSTEEFTHRQPVMAQALDAEGEALVAKLKSQGMVIDDGHGHPICETRGRRYMSGGWLEELAWLAAREAGADEVIYGQVVGWQVQTFTGENEIDLIIRKGRKLGFVSCKALRSELDITDRKHRNRLMDAVHEADNLADHFGKQGEQVAVLVTTDLYDEIKHAPRYNALMGKAAVLDVRIIALEELGWDNLVKAMKGLMT